MTILGLSSRLAIRPSFTQLSPITLDKGGGVLSLTSKSGRSLTSKAGSTLEKKA